MSTTTEETTTPNTPFSRLSEQGEELLRGARKASSRYLDLYESAADKAVSLERRLAASAQPEWVKSLIEGHANLAAELNETYVSAARELLS